MNRTIRIALIYGSTREGRLCDTVADWVAREIGPIGGYEIDRIDPLAMDLPWRHQNRPGPAVLDLRKRLERADAFVVVTPEYNHSFPAALKFLIDSAKGEWAAKPVAFVSYGGLSGGSRAVEQLRQIFVELHAMTIRDSLSFINVWDRFDARGEVIDADATRRALEAMMARLAWWATALRDARDAAPYTQAA